jgi:GNAT superfamily N-acetyltransferase
MGSLRELEPEAAVAALAPQAELAAPAARRFAEDGFVYSWSGAPLVAGIAVDAVDGAVQLYLPFVAPELRRDGDRFRALLGGLGDRWDEADYVVLRLPAGENPSAPGFAPYSRYVSRAARRSSPLAEYEIRPPRREEQPFVRELLAAAIRYGYEASGRDVTPERAHEYVDSAFAELSPEGPASSLVAVAGGEPIGQGTWLHESVDDVDERSFFELVDITVHEDYRGKGAGEAILAAIEAAVAPAGGILLGHVVQERSGRGEAILARLLHAGWQREYDLWLSSS